ncbi:MAG: hypothetical protein RIS69_1897 [Actinomycetota bacterium]
MAISLSELDLPAVEFDFADAEEHRNALLALSKDVSLSCVTSAGIVLQL